MYLFVFSHVLANFLAQKIHPSPPKKTRENCKKFKIDQKKWPIFLGHSGAVTFRAKMKNPARKAIGPYCRLTFSPKRFMGHGISFFWKILAMDGPRPKIGPQRVRTSENSWKWNEKVPNKHQIRVPRAGKPPYKAFQPLFSVMAKISKFGPKFGWPKIEN